MSSLADWWMRLDTLDRILSVIGGLVVATLAAIAGLLTLAYSYVRWAVARRVKRLRTYLKEDQ